MSSSTWDKKVLSKRNKDIAKRFDYWYNKERKRIEDVFYKLSWEEFFITCSALKIVLKEEGCNFPCFGDNRVKRHEHFKTLKEARNHKLTLRSNYLYDTKGLRYDDVITKLSKEFYISETRVKGIFYTSKSKN